MTNKRVGFDEKSFSIFSVLTILDVANSELPTSFYCVPLGVPPRIDTCVYILVEVKYLCEGHSVFLYYAGVSSVHFLPSCCDMIKLHVCLLYVRGVAL